MNIYKVDLGQVGSCVKVRSYVVVASSIEEATHGSAMRRNMDEYLVERSSYLLAGEVVLDKSILSTMIEFEMPLTREEMNSCSYLKNAPLREYDVITLVKNVPEEYTEGQILCCDYYPG